MKQYHDLCKYILENGVKKEDRTGTGTLSVFGYQMRFDLSKGFPLLTTKRIPFRIIAEELFWFIKGDTNIKYLLDKNVNIWNADAYRNFKEIVEFSNRKIIDKEEFIEKVRKDGWDLGPIYGKQWRSWDIGDKWPHSIDQLSDVIEQIKENPNSRRLIVSAWNPGEIEDMALPPCHILFQFYVANGKLSCQLYQRSGDVFLGVPFNIASYALLTHIIAQECGLEVGEFIHTLGDAHIYLNHIEQVKLQLSRDFKELPTLKLKNNKTTFETMWEDIELIGYKPHPTIKGDVSVG